MTGAEALIRAAVAGGVTICFANPGTTEIPIVAALDEVAGMKAVLGLFEGVCTGAADGYGRVTAKPAMTLLHLGPGLANGVANLHNARRARTPLFNVIGEHATWHRLNGPPLTIDIEALAATVSAWVRTTASADALSADVADGLNASLGGRVSTLIVPSDLQQADVSDFTVAAALPPFAPLSAEPIERAARLLKAGRKTAMILGGRALREAGLAAAARVKAATACDLLADSFPPYLERGGGLPILRRIPYFPEAALDLLSPYDAVVLAGAREPVTFFGYPGIPGRLLKEGKDRLVLSDDGQDEIAALQGLADALDGPPAFRAIDAPAGPRPPVLSSGPLTPETICLTLAALQPENAIIVDEGLTTAFPYYGLSAGAPRHSLMTIVGGAIGYGMPAALGAALAAPDRKVINIEADGSGLYTVQALWSQARAGADITTLVCSNRRYHILEVELSRSGMDAPGPEKAALTQLSPPAINWVEIAAGFGVEAMAVDTAEGLARALAKALSARGPHLIEMLL
ncbi:MAG: acetolactate synthase large subunit [Syntrophorhabdales bacterium]|jgi:acetolactate synthase-1/2/3 large subunit